MTSSPISRTIRLHQELSLLAYSDGQFKTVQLPPGDHALRIELDASGEPARVELGFEIDCEDARASGLVELLQ